MADILEAVNIQWHPGFYGAAELEFLSMKEDLEQREQETLLKAIRNLMETMKCSAEQAMTALKIPEADKGKYIARL